MKNNCFGASLRCVLLLAIILFAGFSSKAQIITTFAGQGGTGYNGDSIAATAAQLYGPQSVLVDTSGNVYILDRWNARIRKVNVSGTITTIAGTGAWTGWSGDGRAATATNLAPLSFAFDTSGNLLIGEYAKLRRISTTGIVSTMAGTGTMGYSGDGGAATAARLNEVAGVAVDRSGNIFIADQANSRIRKIDGAGVITTIAGTSTAGFNGDGGAATAARLNYPGALHCNSAGELFCSDYRNDRVRKINRSGIITTVAGNGSFSFSGDGHTATAAGLFGPDGICTDTAGNLYITCYQGNRIRKVDTTGIITTIGGIGTAEFNGDGMAATATAFGSPRGVAMDRSGNLFVAEAWNQCSRVRKIGISGTVSTVAGMSHPGFSGDGGSATAAQLNGGNCAFISPDGSAYLADGFNARVRRVNASGIISTYAGTGTHGHTGDGGPATAAAISGYGGVSGDRWGNIYIIDSAYIRKVTPSGVISTIAGGGTSTADGVAGTAASINTRAIVCDTSGNLFYADAALYKVRMINSSGTVTTVAGNGAGFSGDGGAATAAGIGSPNAICINQLGELLIGSECRIRKVSTSGTIVTIAGNGSGGYRGDGGPATAANISNDGGMAVDRVGNIYFADFVNSAVRRVSASGIISTVTGNHGWGYTGDGYAATAAKLNGPEGLAIDSVGNLYISDGMNSCIRKILFCPSPHAGRITGATAICAGSTITLTDTASHGSWSSGNPTVASIGTSTGVVTGRSGGSTLIVFSVNNGCGTDTATHLITVGTAPIVGSITGSSSLCIGDTATLRDTAAHGTWRSIFTTVSIDSITGLVTGRTAGIASINYIISNSCGSDTATHAITVGAPPVVGSITGRDSICIGDTTTLRDTTAMGVWGTNNAAVASISTMGVVTATAGGSATLWYTASNSCGADTAFHSIWVKSVTECTTGFRVLAGNTTTNLSIFPNPTTGTFTLRLTTPADEEATVTITNVLGQKVWTQAFTSNRDVAVNFDVAAGMYLVRVTGKNGTSAVTHVVKE